ncbi:MAG: YicC family protein [Gammaproteobacteria bacterium]|nr:YicC family protein [Gammaproteobacteria bacterium]
MIRSMTAFARLSASAEWGDASLELRSVNNRYLDVFFRLPEDVRAAEPVLRERISQRLGRGKVDCTLKLDKRAAGDSLQLDLEQARRVLAAIASLRELDDEGVAGDAKLGPVDPIDVLRWPGVVRQPDTGQDDLLPAMRQLMDRALDELIATREREGARIDEFIQSRCAGIDALVDEAEQRLPSVIAQQRQRLHDRLAEILEQVDKDRLEQELVLFSNRIDVAEELDRLRTHVKEVRRTLTQDKPVGRRLDFLMQELNREANTLGSKSVDSDMTRISVDLKVLIEQVREQVQNVE